MTTNIQTIEQTNLYNDTIDDKDIVRLVIILNNGITYKYPESLRNLPSVKNINNTIIPSAHDINFNFEKISMVKLKIIAKAYLLKIPTKLKKNEIIELIKKRMRLITSIPSYSSNEYEEFVNSLSISERGISSMELTNDLVLNEYQISLINSYRQYNTIIDIKNTKLAKIAYRLYRKLHIRYYKLLGVASVKLDLCNNLEDMISMESIYDIPYGELYTFKHNGVYYAFSIDSFASYIKYKKYENPYTRQKFPYEIDQATGKIINSIPIISNFNTIQNLYNLVTGKYINNNKCILNKSMISSIYYYSLNYQFQDELLLTNNNAPQMNDYCNIFYEINSLCNTTKKSYRNNTYKLLSYLTKVQEFVKKCSIILNDILELYNIIIEPIYFNSRYIYCANNWGLNQDIRKNNGIHFMQRLTGYNLVNLNEILRLFCDDETIIIDYDIHIPIGIHPTFDKISYQMHNIHRIINILGYIMTYKKEEIDINVVKDTIVSILHM
jgi:hypothetical protein